MPRVQATRLRYISGSSSEELEIIFNALPFKVEIKGIAKDGKGWTAWAVLPDNIDHGVFNESMKRIITGLKSEAPPAKERKIS